MKNYNEMANDVFRRAKEHKARQKKAVKRKITLIVTVCLCLGVCSGVALTSHTAPETKFKKNIQQEILGKTYDLSFVKFDSERVPTKAIYTNDLGDDFEYDIKTGYLCEAFINSNMVEKSDDSIDIDTAYNIALKLLPEGISIENYTQLAYRQSAKGYFFRYVKYIGKYRTTASFSATIGYDGSVVDFRDTTYKFVGKNIDLDEEYITSKIDEFAKEKNAVNVDYDDAIVINTSKLLILVSYETEGGCHQSVAHIPLE